MATKIIHKKSSVAASVPASGDIEAGELAVNLADKKLYSKQTDGTVIAVGVSDYNDLENLPADFTPAAHTHVKADITDFNEDDYVSVTGDVMSGNLSFGDNDKAIFGAGSDLQIYHDGSNSIIKDAGAGNLFIDATDFKLRSAIGENMLTMTTNGKVGLRYNGLEKLATTSTGISVTGNATFADNDKAIFGAGNDLQIYHDGTHSKIQDTGTGDLKIQATNLLLEAIDGTNYIYCVDDGRVDLNYNGSVKLATTSTGIDVTGTVTADGLTVNSGATNTAATFESTDQYAFVNFQDNTSTDGTFIGAEGNNFIVQSDSTKRLFQANKGGDISFYEDTGTTAKLIWDASDEALEFADNAKASFGAGSDLQIYHDGSHSYITDSGTGNLRIRGTDITLQDASGNGYISMVDGGAGGTVYLKHLGSNVLTTTSTGIDVTGTVTADGLTVDGSSAGRITSAEFKNNLNAGGTEVAINLANQGGTSNADVNLVAYRSGANFGSDFYIETSDGVDGTNRKRLNVGENGDISFYEDTGTTAKFFWDASAERLGIGTTGPAATIDVVGSGRIIQTNSTALTIRNQTQSIAGGNSTLKIGSTDTAAADKGGQLNFTANTTSFANYPVAGIHGYHETLGASNYSGYLSLFTTSTGGSITERMRIDSSGNVGVGTSSPSSYWANADDLVVATSGNTGISVVSGTTSLGYLIFADSTAGGDNTRGGLGYDHSTNNMLFRVNNDTKMTIDSSGNVGVGTASPSRDLEVHSSTGGNAYISAKRDNATSTELVLGAENGNTLLSSVGAIPMAFYTNGSEAMRIDSSGQLLVGKTSADNTTAGGSIFAGVSSFVNDGARALTLVRNTSDGDIVEFRKGGATVGSIGAYLGDSYVGTGAAGLRFYDAGPAITPHNTTTNAGTDGTIDLGTSAGRFKDLYLSGTVTADGLTVGNGTQQIRTYVDADEVSQLIDANVRYDLWTGGSKTMRLDANGDISFYEDTGTTPKFFWDASAESLSIGSGGTATPSANLIINDSATSGFKAKLTSSAFNADGNWLGLGMGYNNGYMKSAIISEAKDSNARANLHFALDSDLGSGNVGLADAKMTITYDGNVGIGTSSPDRQLVIHNDSSFAGLKLSEGTNNTDVRLTSSDGGLGIIGTFSAHDMLFYSNSAERMRIDSSGNVGIGESSPATALHVNSGATNEAARFESTDTEVTLELKDTTGTAKIKSRADFRFETGATPSEAMRIDSSGNLLVGTTTTDTTAAAGFTVQSDGQLYLSADSQHVATMTRLTNDGDILTFRRSAIGGAGLTTVGRIGVTTGPVSYLVLNDTISDNVGAIKGGSRSILPSSNTGGTQNGTMDLGGSSDRFRDLYLSGGVYLGGTGSANHLDDYEEGTWTPVIADASSAGNTSSTTATSATYTKVGNLVTIQMNIQNIDTTGMTSANDIFIRGLPFAVKSVSGSSYFTGSLLSTLLNFTGNISVVAEDNFSHLYIAETSSGAGADLVTIGEISSGSTDLWFSLTYMTA